MRHLSLLLLVLISVALAGAEPFHCITVHGRARELASADRFQIDASISVVKPRLEEAQQGAEAVLEKALQALAKAGQPKPMVNGRQFGRRTHWNPQTQEQVQDGFLSTVSMVVTLDTKERLDAVLAVLVQSDEVAVSGVTYRVQREIELRKEVRRRALLAAKDKAADMAATLGAELGPVWAINEPSPMWRASLYTNSVADNRAPTLAGEDRPTEGMVEVVADVDVSFALKSSP